jgi:hypothetical protein
MRATTKVSWNVCRDGHRAVAEDRRRILPRSRHRARAWTDGSLNSNLNKGTLETIWNDRLAIVRLLGLAALNTVVEATQSRVSARGRQSRNEGSGREQVTTYVGIDAHKKDLFIAMLVGQQKTPVTRYPPNPGNSS